MPNISESLTMLKAITKTRVETDKILPKISLDAKVAAPITPPAPVKPVAEKAPPVAPPPAKPSEPAAPSAAPAKL